MQKRYVVAILGGLALAFVVAVMGAHAAPLAGQTRTQQACANVDFGWTDNDSDSSHILQWAHLESALSGYWVKSVSYKFTAIRTHGNRDPHRGTSPGDENGNWTKFVEAKTNWGDITLTYELPAIKLTDGETTVVCKQRKVSLHLAR